MAQTAVEFLEKQLTLAFGDELKDLRGLFVVAKEMDKKEKRYSEEEVNVLLDRLLDNNMCSVLGDALIQQFKKK